jgi:hypothetical protein
VVPRAGPHVEDAVALLQLEQLRHPRDDQRLGDRLAAVDRQRDVVVGALPQLGRYEQLSRHIGQRGQHALVLHARAQLVQERAAGELSHGSSA